jgi:hypothetical protein
MLDPTQLHTYPPVYKTHNKNRRETVEEVIENSSTSKCSIKGAEKPFSGAQPHLWRNYNILRSCVQLFRNTGVQFIFCVDARAYAIAPLHQRKK